MPIVHRSYRSSVARAAAGAAFAMWAAAQLPLSASDPGGGDWPMWGGTPDRNMVSKAVGLPLEWDAKTRKNVKWVAQLCEPS